MYSGKVIQANNIMPHPNADRMMLLSYNGVQFVIGKDIEVGQTVVLFPTDGQLSDEFCKANNLYRDASKNKDRSKTGFFDDNRRVKAQGFRKQKSYGFVASLEMFDYLKGFSPAVGDDVAEFGKHEICRKYYTPATLNRMSKIQQKKVHDVEYHLAENYDTQRFSYYLPVVTVPTVAFISEKIHGTSARTGNVLVTRRIQNPIHRVLSMIFRRFVGKEISAYELVSGTRRTICNKREDITTEGQQDYYRWQWHQKIAPQLNKGETVYYEICGYDSLGGTIMEVQNTDKLQDRKNISPLWPNPMIYTYGVERGENDVYVYRITQASESGNVVDLSWFEVEARAKELGLKVVPVLQAFMPSNTEEVVEAVKAYMVESSSTITDRHLMEGVVIRLESPNGIVVLKEKNFMFGVLEGYLKESDEYVDMEEVN